MHAWGSSIWYTKLNLKNSWKIKKTPKLLNHLK